jgi:hypothetical protein
MYWLCVCSLSHRVCKAHAPYCIVICGMSGCTTFCPIFSLMADFWKNEPNIKCILWLSLYLLSETFLLLRRNNRDTVTNVQRYPWKVPATVVRFLIKIEFCKYILEKSQIPVFMKILPVRAELSHSGGPTETHYDAKRRFSHFGEGA